MMSRLLALVVLCLCLFAADARAAVPSPGASCADNTEGAKACYSNGCFVCTSGTWVAQPMLLGATASSCVSGLNGMVQYTASALSYCNGTSWGALGSTSTGGSGTTPDAFSFTNQTGVDLNATISSNAVALTGYTGIVTATCGTNCTAIARNGVWGGTTMPGFRSGDTIAIRMTSSATANTAKTATVTVGTTTSGTWSVTTNNSTPSAISFTNQTGVALGVPITSNAVTLSGFTGTAKATCAANCTAIARNGVWGGTTVTGFASGDTIQIRLTSSTSFSTAKTTSVTVGTTTSSTWSVTTSADACSGVSTLGTVCADGTIYIGTDPESGQKLMTTRCDGGQTWSGSACTGTPLDLTWDNGIESGPISGYTSYTAGKANTEGLANDTGIYAPHMAAKYCYDLDIHGHTDWFLPAADQAQDMVENPSYFNFTGDYHWESTDSPWTDGMAMVFVVSTNTPWEADYKSSTNPVRCVRTN